MTTTCTREHALLAELPRSWSMFLAANDELRLIQRDQNGDGVVLTAAAAECREQVLMEAQAVLGQNWNYWSNALQRRVVETFDTAVGRLEDDGGPVDFLEIGSCQGLSMGIIGALLRRHGVLRSLTSVDPYWEDGYDEVGHLDIDKQTRKLAFQLYERLRLPVRLVEAQSFEGLPQLIREGCSYRLIYIDGRHQRLNPVVDFGLSWALLEDGGIIMLDDHRWPDVAPLKAQCDEHLERVHESWKVAAYVKRSWK